MNGAFTEWIFDLMMDSATARYFGSVTFNGPQELPPPSTLGLGSSRTTGTYANSNSSSALATTSGTSSSSNTNSSSSSSGSGSGLGAVDPSVLRDYAALTNPLVVVYSGDLSGFDMGFAVSKRQGARQGSGKFGWLRTLLREAPRCTTQRTSVCARFRTKLKVLMQLPNAQPLNPA